MTSPVARARAVGVGSALAGVGASLTIIFVPSTTVALGAALVICVSVVVAAGLADRLCPIPVETELSEPLTVVRGLPGAKDKPGGIQTATEGLTANS